jgi:Dolichyl-phosphate-mannose-protein mannosyltransferase
MLHDEAAVNERAQTRSERATTRVRQFVAALRRHRWPLLIVTSGVALAHVFLLIHHPAMLAATDSDEYLAVANSILTKGNFFDPLRTPGYPALLALVFLIRGARDITAVFVAQMALMIVATYEIYLLVARLTKRRYLASVAALLVGCNYFVLQWEFALRPEALSFWTLITLFLVAERLLHGLRPVTLTIFGVLLFFAIMVRPFDILLPAVLLAALALRGVWMGEWRTHVLRLGLVLLVVYGAILGYIQLNGLVTGYAGLSYASNVNLLGKVMEYRLQDLPVSPQLTPVQRDTAQYVRDQGSEPWRLTGRPWAFAREYGYDRDFYEPVGAYGRYVILHYPQYFVPATLRETVTVWSALPLPYISFEYARGGHIFVDLSLRVFWLAYLALPIAALLALMRLRKDPRDLLTFMLLLMAAASLITIVVAAAGSYDEPVRSRFPTDWIPIILLILTSWWVWTLLRAWIGGMSSPWRRD